MLNLRVEHIDAYVQGMNPELLYVVMKHKILLLLSIALTSCSTPVAEIPLVIPHGIPQGARVVVIADKETAHLNTIANGLSTNKKVLHDIILKPNSKTQLKFDRESKDVLLALYVDPHGRLGNGTIFRPCDVFFFCLEDTEDFGVLFSSAVRFYGFFYTELYLKRKFRKIYYMWRKLEQQMHAQK